MPAVSKNQQRSAAIALQAKREGKIDELPAGSSSKEMAQSMSEKELEKFASTKLKGLPKSKESKEWAGSSLAETFREELDEETLNLVSKAKEHADDQITTQKSKKDRLEDQETDDGKKTKDTWDLAAGGKQPSLATKASNQMSSNTMGTRVAESTNPNSLDLLFEKDWSSWDEPWGHNDAGASEELGSTQEEKMFNHLWDDYLGRGIPPTDEDPEELFNDVFGYYSEEDEDIEDAERAIARAQELYAHDIKSKDLEESSEELDEVAPKGWEGTVKAMKKSGRVENPWALANWMKKKGYQHHESANNNKDKTLIKESINPARWQELAGILKEQAQPADSSSDAPEEDTSSDSSSNDSINENEWAKEPGPSKIISYYETWSPEDVEAGDTDNRGELDVDEIKVDDFDHEEGITKVELAVDYLEERGVTEASSSHFHPGVWYTTHGDQNFRTGEVTYESYHLKGFTKEEEEEIFNRITNG